MFYQVMRKDCFGSRRDTKRFLVKVFQRLSFLQDKERSAKESRAKFFACGRYGYTHVYIHIVLYDTFNVR